MFVAHKGEIQELRKELRTYSDEFMSKCAKFDEHVNEATACSRICAMKKDNLLKENKLRDLQQLESIANNNFESLSKTVQIEKRKNDHLEQNNKSMCVPITARLSSTVLIRKCISGMLIIA